jgi:hypothetical protein
MINIVDFTKSLIQRGQPRRSRVRDQSFVLFLKEDMRYLCYTERASGTLNSYTAEELVKEFYDPKGVQEVLEKYVK